MSRKYHYIGGEIPYKIIVWKDIDFTLKSGVERLAEVASNIRISDEKRLKYLSPLLANIDGIARLGTPTIEVNTNDWVRQAWGNDEELLVLTGVVRVLALYGYLHMRFVNPDGGVTEWPCEPCKEG